MWEAVDQDEFNKTTRLAVPGGWLYRVIAEAGNDGIVQSLVFVPAGPPPPHRNRYLTKE